MTTLFNSAAPVKPARKFAAGVLASRPAYSAPYTAADLAWLVEDDARREAADREFDRLAAESAFMDRYEAGIAG